jgi:GNAT superfamily N-acetyltransferase
VGASADLGKARRLNDAPGRYIEFCKSTFANDLTLRDMKLVVDAAHGAAYQVAPNVFHELGAEVTSIGCAPDGLNINKGFGATHPEALVAAVTAQKADYGIALDGDADRLQLVDASGRLFNGDELLYLMVAERIARGEKPVGVVGTLMTNKAVEVALRGQGIEFVRAKVGDRYVLEELDKRGWILGGEGSGHLLALDRHTTGDGIVSALQVLQACVRSGKTVAQLLEGVTLFPQTLINVRLAPGQDWKSNKALASETQRIEAELGDGGRVLIRASGTEPLVRVMVEARDAKQSESCAKRLAATLEPAQSRASTVLADYRDAAQAAALVDLLDAYARDPAGGGTPLEAAVREGLPAALAARPQAFSVLAFDGDTPVGLINCIEGFSTFACKPLVNVHDVVVLASHRGQRVAQQMFARVEQEARKRGACKLTLEVLRAMRRRCAATSAKDSWATSSIRRSGTRSFCRRSSEKEKGRGASDAVGPHPNPLPEGRGGKTDQKRVTGMSASVLLGAYLPNSHLAIALRCTSSGPSAKRSVRAPA